MNRVTFLSPAVAVTGALSPADFAKIAGQGFRAVISNRPEDEEPAQMTLRETAVNAWRAGLVFRHVPAAKHEVLDQHVIDAMAKALAGVQGPVLLHCKTGLRAAILWAAVRARHEPLDAVMAALKAAGFDLDDLREDIAAQARCKETDAPDCCAAA